MKINLDQIFFPAIGKLLVSLLAVLCLPGLSISAPSISGVSGTVTHGQLLTISGSGFGTKTSAAPAVWDNGAGTNILNAWDGAWPEAGSQPECTPKYHSPMRGVPTAHANVQKYLAGCAPGTGVGYPNNVMVWKDRTITSFPAYSYISFYTRNDPLYDSGDNYKWFDYSTGNTPYTMNTSTDSNWYLEYVGGLGNDFHINDDGGSIYNQAPDWTLDYQGNSKYFGGSINPKNQWVKIEVAIKYTNQNDGWIDIYENGNLIKSGSAPHSYNGATDKYAGSARNEAIGGFSRNGTINNWRYFNDIYLDYTLAHVILGNSSSYQSCSIREVQIPTSWSNGSITFNVNLGAFQQGQTAYLYVVDNTGAVSGGRAVTVGGSGSGGGTTPTDNPPTISISSPTTSSSYTTSQNSLNIGGTSSDDIQVASVAWNNSLGGNGTANLNAGNWSVSGISLQIGTNVITVTATDSAGQTATDSLSVVYNEVGSTTPPEDSVWNADSNIGGGQWYNSGVTYCVRILIPGEQITQSGNTIKLGFQGRSSGSYSIRGVSIAERDQNGSVGDVVDSTWKKVTFDKKAETYLAEPLIADSWDNYQVVVPAGTEKVSNAISFDIYQGRDYYVTFKIVTPSVYQNPPAGYSELYFDSADHTQNLDWSGTGFGTTQDYHALSNIYISSETTSPTFK